ncbi:hypothetical protein LJC56_11545 [Christensenellaceae bacterium OttesenSCG-928-K19]|nr:hypothetical protein [Christensenellaceae bacterium OttesenSCG-928-K19]
MKKRILLILIVLAFTVATAGCAPFLNLGAAGGGASGGDMEFLNLMMAATPQDMEAVVGEPDSLERFNVLNVQETPFLCYTYSDNEYGVIKLEFEAAEEDGEYMLCRLHTIQSGGPFTITIGGVSVGMTLEQADATLQEHGFLKTELTDFNGGLYYTLSDAQDGGQTIAILYLDENGDVCEVCGKCGVATQWGMENHVLNLNTDVSLPHAYMSADFMDIVAVNTPENIVAVYGEPTNTVENDNSGVLMRDCWYGDTTIIGFQQTEQGFVLNELILNGEDNRFTVGGVYVGMDLAQAESALGRYGFSYAPDYPAKNNGRFYELDARGAPGHFIVLLGVNDGQINDVGGYWGYIAGWVLDYHAASVSEPQTPTEPDATPAPEVEQAPPNEMMDFLDVYGANTPEDVVAAFGEPDEIVENDNPGFLAMSYYYSHLDTRIEFEMTEDEGYVLNYIGVDGATCPFTVGGVGYGMEFHEAEAALGTYGFEHMPGLTDEFGGRFYQEPEGDDPYSPVIIFYTDEDAKVTSVGGYASQHAQWLLESYATRV